MFFPISFNKYFNILVLIFSWSCLGMNQENDGSKMYLLNGEIRDWRSNKIIGRWTNEPQPTVQKMVPVKEAHHRIIQRTSKN